jgi:NIPSNAP
MITCVVDYVIDPDKTADFERFATRWMELVERHGGTHHGYFLPAEGASDRALALFSFPSLAAYETYPRALRRRPRVRRGRPDPRRERVRAALRPQLHAPAPAAAAVS